MKKPNSLTMLLLAITGFACNNDYADRLSENVKICILPTVEINQDEYTPLRSTGSEDSLIYAVQIYEEGIPCYYGLFNDVSKMEIALTTNKNYVLKIAAYQNGSGSGLKNTENDGLITYYLPDTVCLLNKFVEGDRLTGISSVSNAQLTDNKYSQYPEIDVFYQEKEVSITKGVSNIEIPLKRTGFGLGISVDGLNTGNIEVYFAGDTIHLTPSIKSYYTIRSFIGGTKGLDDVAKVDTYFVNTNISVKWIGNNGTVVTASKTIKIKRNYQLPLYINFNSTDAGITLDSWQNDIADSIIKSSIPTLGLIAWFPFSSNAVDQSGNGYVGTVHGATLTMDRFGNTNSAYSFNGSDNYISTDINLVNQNKISLSAWFSTINSVSNSTDHPTMIGSRLAQTRFTGLGFNEDGLYFDIMNDLYGLRIWDKSSSPADGVWHQIVGTYDGKNGKIYFDGLLINSDTLSINTAIIQASVIFGLDQIQNNGNRYWKGSIDDIGIWNRVLTQEEITKLYNQ